MTRVPRIAIWTAIAFLVVASLGLGSGCKVTRQVGEAVSTAKEGFEAATATIKQLQTAISNANANANKQSSGPGPEFWAQDWMAEIALGLTALVSGGYGAWQWKRRRSRRFHKDKLN